MIRTIKTLFAAQAAQTRTTRTRIHPQRRRVIEGGGTG
jgi:hypothetical protein